MSERQKQTDFLKMLILYEDTDERRQLQERIRKAERDECCLRRVIFLVVLLGLFSLAGLGYSAVLLPDFFRNSTHFLIKLFCALGLGSLICLVTFGVYWFWFRGVLDGLHEECRRYVLAVMASKSYQAETKLSTLSVKELGVEVYQVTTSSPQAATHTLSLTETP